MFVPAIRNGVPSKENRIPFALTNRLRLGVAAARLAPSNADVPTSTSRRLIDADIQSSPFPPRLFHQAAGAQDSAINWSGIGAATSGFQHLLPQRNVAAVILLQQMDGLTGVKDCIRMHVAHESG
jgi:hypothetical protein